MATERPILFNSAMVRAVLAGTKTQTRRILRVPDFEHWYTEDQYIVDESGTTHPGVMERRYLGPFGSPDDKLWVRETFATSCNADGHPITIAGQLCSEREAERCYRADTTPGPYGCDSLPDGRQHFGRWTPSIHMPRWASRITLDVCSVLAERLQDITEEDAKAEGAPMYVIGHGPIDENDLAVEPGYWCDRLYRNGFEHLWTSIYGPESWAANPLVWVCDFRRVTP